MAEYYNKNIKYKGFSDKGLTIQVIDENDDKYSIWKADFNDKSKDSEAYEAFKNIKLGEEFGISFGEKPESFTNDQGKTINFTKRTIYSILPVIDQVAIRTPQSTPKAESPRYEPITAPQSESREDFGKRLAIHGFINAQITYKGLNDIGWDDIAQAFELEDWINERLAQPKPKGWDTLGAKLKAEAKELNQPIAPDIQEMATEMEEEDAIPF